MKIRRFVLGILLLCPLLISGCASYRNATRKEYCERAIRDYNKMIRWQEIESAALLFIESGNRASFDKTAEDLHRRNVTIADYRILAQHCLPEQKKAEATVEFGYFALPDNRLKTLTDHQTWIFREQNDAQPDLPEGWKLTSPLPEFR